MKRRLGIITAGVLLLALAAPGAWAQGRRNVPKVRKPSAGEELVALMKKIKISVAMENAPLQDLVHVVREHLNKNFIISPKVWAEHSEEDVRVTVTLKEVSIHSLLRVTLLPRELTVTVREGVLMVVPLSVVTEKVSAKFYDVRDLVLPIRDFKAPQVRWGIQDIDHGLRSASYSSIFGSIASSDEDYDDGGTALDTLQLLIETHTGGDSWVENPDTSLSFVNGLMVISQTKKTHKEIKTLLRQLRRMR